MCLADLASPCQPALGGAKARVSRGPIWPAAAVGVGAAAQTAPPVGQLLDGVLSS